MTITTAAALVGEAKTRIENLDAAAFDAERGADGALVVDLREPGERAELGTIPGALAVPRGLLEFVADPASPKHNPDFGPERRVLLYCASGGRSALAADTLAAMGFGNVAHLDGGFTAWTEAGLPVEALGREA